MNYFNKDGRRIPSKDFRVFSDTPKNFYQIKQPIIDFTKILNNSIRFGGVSTKVRNDQFEKTCETLKKRIATNNDFLNLFNGVHIPFICKQFEPRNDLGKDLEDIDLPALQKSFCEKFPESHFKAILQSDSKLTGSISFDPRSRYEKLLDMTQKNNVVGWYFPQALQEFDIESQRMQMEQLPISENICLSGGIDITASLIGSPEILISDEFYSPILCMSAYVHSDPRLILLLKSYGPHLEFWCMTQMLTSTTTQVSEQWSGGVSIFTNLQT